MIQDKLVNIVLFSLCCVNSFVYADPVQFDTEDAHVIVIRYVDSWSGNSSSNENTLKNMEKKITTFAYINNEGKKIYGMKDGSYLFNGKSIFPWSKTSIPDEVVLKTTSELTRFGFTLGGDEFYVERPYTVKPTEMPSLLATQDKLFTKTVFNQGDPATLPGRMRNKKIFSTLIGIASIGIGAGKFGAQGADFVASSGFIDDIGRLTFNAQNSLVAIPSVPFDYSSYQSIDIRKVTEAYNARAGQIIIAYKGEKTQQAEEKALSLAIATSSGADASVESVEESRKNDLARRQAIWDDCVAKSLCKEE